MKGVRVSTSSGVSDQVIRLSDSGSEISYNSICKQIDEGLKEGFSESEVIRTVIKVTYQVTSGKC